jgi:predicted nucleotidyltransferase
METVDIHGLSCSVDLFQYGSPIWPSNPDGLCGIKHGMNKQEILDRLRENERALRERGVTHAALFGSRARGQERSDSDIDIMVEVDPDAHISLFDYAGIVQYIEELFPVPVDVANREGLKPFVRPSAEREAVYAF